MLLEMGWRGRSWDVFTVDLLTQVVDLSRLPSSFLREIHGLGKIWVDDGKVFQCRMGEIHFLKGPVRKYLRGGAGEMRGGHENLSSKK